MTYQQKPSAVVPAQRLSQIGERFHRPALTGLAGADVQSDDRAFR